MSRILEEPIVVELASVSVYMRRHEQRWQPLFDVTGFYLSTHRFRKGSYIINSKHSCDVKSGLLTYIMPSHVHIYSLGKKVECRVAGLAANTVVAAGKAVRSTGRINGLTRRKREHD